MNRIVLFTVSELTRSKNILFYKKVHQSFVNEFFKNVAEILQNRTLSMFHGRGAENTASSAEEKLKQEGRFIKFITKALFQPRLEFFYL